MVNLSFNQFKLLQEHQLKDRSVCVSFSKNDEFLSFSEGSTIKIYNNIHQIANEPTFSLNFNNDIICMKYNNIGDSMI